VMNFKTFLQYQHLHSTTLSVLSSRLLEQLNRKKSRNSISGISGGGSGDDGSGDSDGGR